MPHDLSHAATERGFHRALWSTEVPAGLAAPDPGDIEQRFKVYRNNVLHSLTRALAARFAVVEQLVGPEFFAALARAFVATNPPRDPVLLHWGDAFPAFLDQFPPVAQLPYLGDVARVELARGQACHAADAPPFPPEALNRLLCAPDLDGLRLGLHPSVRLLALATPGVQIWLAHQPGQTRGPITPGPDHALIARQPDFAVIVAPLDAGSFAVLSALTAGATLDQAARLADPTPALALLLRHSLIIETGAPE